MTDADKDAIAELLNRMDEDTDEEREEDLGAFFVAAYPTIQAQNS